MARKRATKGGRVRGGEKLNAWFRSRRRLARELAGDDGKRSVGFHDARIASLAAQHEFGAKGRADAPDLPARPAFRQSMRDVQAGFKRDVREAGRIAADPKGSAADIRDALDTAASKAAETVRDSYRDFKGAPLSEWQQARKTGTLGEGRQLVGHKGERLIDHIEAKDEGGRKVDD